MDGSSDHEANIPRSIERRLQALERQNRRLRSAVLALGIAALSAALLGQAAPRPRSLQADSITLVDAAGRPRLALGVMDDEPFILFKDGKERVRMVMSIDAEGSELTYYDTNGKRRVALAETGPGAGLEFYDPQERRRVGLLTTEETPTLVFADKEARTRMLIGIGDDGPDIEMYSAGAKRRVALGSLEQTGPRFALFDQDGLVRLAAGVSGAGPALILSDDRIQPRLQIDVGAEGPGLVLKRPSGRLGASFQLADGKPALSVVDPNGGVVFSAP